MTTCHKVQKMLPEFVRGELTPEEKQFVVSHIQSCAVCRAVWEEEEKLASRLAGIKTEVSQAFLDENRQRLHMNLVQAAVKRRSQTRPGFMWNFPRWAWQAAALALVLVVGIWLGQHRLGSVLKNGGTPVALENRTGKRQEGETALPSARIVNFNPVNGTITLQFEQTPRKTLRRKVNDPRMEQVLARALRSKTQDGQRLRALGIFLTTAEQKKNRKRRFSPEVLEAICRAARKDPNPGVRLKAIRVLENFPDDSLAKGTLLDILRDDSIPAFRYEALSALVGESSQDVAPILQMLARKDTSRAIRSRANYWLRRIETQTPLSKPVR